MDRIPPNQLNMHPYFMLDRAEYVPDRSGEAGCEEPSRRERGGLIRRGASLVLLAGAVGVVSQLCRALPRRPLVVGAPR